VALVGLVGSVFAALLACTTYGEDAPTKPKLDAASTSGNLPQVDSGGTTSGGTSGGGTDGNPPVLDASDEKPPSGPACPPCPAGMTCFGSGCVTGQSAPNTCAAPYDVTATTKLTGYLCPGGPTITLPAPCNGGGVFNVAVFRLPTGHWTFTATGTNPFIALGDCTEISGCRGGTSPVTQDAPGPGTVLVGTMSKLSACQEVALEIKSL
jgi:hypothetical protein